MKLSRGVECGVVRIDWDKYAELYKSSLDSGVGSPQYKNFHDITDTLANKLGIFNYDLGYFVRVPLLGHAPDSISPLKFTRIEDARSFAEALDRTSIGRIYWGVSVCPVPVEM